MKKEEEIILLKIENERLRRELKAYKVHVRYLANRLSELTYKSDVMSESINSIMEDLRRSK